MRRGYKEVIKVEVITKRLQNLSWKEIQDGVIEKFEAKPSIRQMQKWFEDYQHGDRDPTGVKPIAKTMQDMINQARMLAEAASGPSGASGPTGPQVIEFPSWVVSRDEDEGKLDIKTAIVSSLRLLETQVGKDNFDTAIKYYIQHRDEMDKYDDWFRGPTGPSGPPKSSDITEKDGPTGPYE